MIDKITIFEENPIIAAVKNEEQLDIAIQTNCNIIFFLFGNICNIAQLVQKAKEAGKIAFVHLELTTGLAGKEVAVDFIKNYTQADGVISIKPSLIKRAKALGMLAVLRIFLVDSLALANLSKQLAACDADFIEIMPGIMPKIIRRVKELVDVPVIVGGLITDKEDIMNALSAGAQCISTTFETAWKEF